MKQTLFIFLIYSLFCCLKFLTTGDPTFFYKRKQKRLDIFQTGTALHCTALHCTALHCTALHCTALHCTALHCTALHCTALHCTALHCTALHCTALHCTALYYTVPNRHGVTRVQGCVHTPPPSLAKGVQGGGNFIIKSIWGFGKAVTKQNTVD